MWHGLFALLSEDVNIYDSFLLGSRARGLFDQSAFCMIDILHSYIVNQFLRNIPRDSIEILMNSSRGTRI